MKKVLLIVMLIIAIGLVGCPRRYYDRDRHDQDRGHDYEHQDRHDQNRGQDYEQRDRHDQGGGHDNEHHDHNN